MLGCVDKDTTYQPLGTGSFKVVTMRAIQCTFHWKQQALHNQGVFMLIWLEKIQQVRYNG